MKVKCINVDESQKKERANDRLMSSIYQYGKTSEMHQYGKCRDMHFSQALMALAGLPSIF